MTKETIDFDDLLKETEILKRKENEARRARFLSSQLSERKKNIKRRKGSELRHWLFRKVVKILWHNSSIMRASNGYRIDL